MKELMKLVLLLSLVLATLAGCSKKEPAQSSSEPGQVIATAAYEKYFGAPPQYDKGKAYAFVLYFPSRKEPGKVVPFPFFTFDELSIKDVAIKRLLGGMDAGSYKGEFLSFPEGSRLLSISDAAGTVTADFTKELGVTADVSIAHALALTLTQFKGVKEVVLLIEGKETPLTAMAEKSGDTAVMEPSSPRLLSVTAMRDKGEDEIEEVNAFFDRPVEVKELQLLSKDGQQFEGELYHSVFDMAAVLKPKDPSQFKSGMSVKVRWKVADKLGRQSEGDSLWPLEIKEH